MITGIMFTGIRKWKRIVKTRMRQYNEIKTNTAQVILPDLNSLTQHIKRANTQAYYWVYCITKDIQKYDPCLSGWKRGEETGTLTPLWYDRNQLPQSMSKCCRLSAHKRALTQKSVVINNDRP